MHIRLFDNIPDHSHLPLEDRLKLECLRRTHNGFIAQILLAFMSMAVVPFASHYGEWITAGLLLLIAVQTFRFFYIQRYHNNFPRLISSFNLMMLLTGLTALCWATSAAADYIEFSITSREGFPFTVSILGYIAGLTYSFASMPRLQKIFIPLISWPFLAAAIHDNSSYSWTLFVIFATFLVYMFIISNNHAEDLLHTYQAEEDLRAQREKLKLVINSVPGFVALSDDKGQWIETSASFRNFSNLNVIRDAQDRFRKSGVENFVQEIDWLENGIENSFVLSLARLHRPQNSVVMVGVPINELKEIRRAMEIQRSKSEFSSRLSMVGELAGGVAHEVNNPLAIIVTATFQLKNLLEEEVSQSSQIHHITNKIENTALRISSIVQSLRYFAKQADSEPFEQAQVPLIIQNALNLCQQKFIQNRVDLEIGDIPEVAIPARPVQIGQVLIHLLNNAFDAVQNSPVRKVELRFIQTPSGLIFSVHDTGPGIPETIHHRIFDPFFTTKEIGQGTGIGLSVSKGIIEEHQGNLSFESNQQGSTFRFFIPWHRR